MLQDLGFDHLPILLSVPLSPVYRPNKHPPSFDFQKACWDGFASYFDSHCPSAEEYSSLYLSSAAAALFTSLALNAAKSSFLLATSNALLKHGGLLRCKVQLLKDARFLLLLTEVRKIGRLTSPLLDAPYQSLPRLRHGRRLALYFYLNLTLNLCTLLRSIAGSPSSSSSSLNFLNCSSPRESASVYATYLRSHFSVFQPKALCSRPRGYLSEFG